MGLPAKDDVQQRAQTAAAQLKRLEDAQAAFFTAWEDILHEEKQLNKEVAAYVDKEKLKHILDTIHSPKQD